MIIFVNHYIFIGITNFRMDVELDLIEESYGTFQQFNIDIPKEDADMVYGLRYAFQNMLSTVSFIDTRKY